MPTSEEARDWLAHAISNGELAHHGVIGMHWGQHMAGITASGISSQAIDRQAKNDAKQHTYFHADTSTDKGAMLQRARISAQVARRSAASPNYAKAYAYHKPRAERNLKIRDGVITGAVIGGAAAWLAYRHADFLTRAAGSAALKVSARRGAKAAGPILQAIGNKPLVTLVKGADGIFRLAA